MRIFLFLMASVVLYSSQTYAFSKQCTDVDANSVKQVQTCIASSSQMSNGLDAAGKDFSGCNRLKMSFTMLTGVRADADSDMMPGCHVFAKVLENLNGRKPVWANCIDFAENQTNLSACYAALKKAQMVTNTFDSKTCPRVKAMLQQVITGMSGNYMPDFKKLPRCEKIAAAMRENNHEMSGYACGKYQPESQKHINVCLHSYFAAYKYYGMQLNQSCDQLRMFYNAGVQSMYDGEKTINQYGMASEPPDFQVAQCGMLEAAVESYNEEQYAYEQFDNTEEAEEPVKKSSGKSAKARDYEEEDEEPVRRKQKTKSVSVDEEEEEPADGKSILKQMALDRAGESKKVNKTLTKAAEYQEQYDEAVEDAEEYEDEYEEEEEPEDIEKQAKKKLTKKLFDKLGL